MATASLASLAPIRARVLAAESSITERAVSRFRVAIRSAEARAVLATARRESTAALLAAANCSVFMDIVGSLGEKLIITGRHCNNVFGILLQCSICGRIF